MSEPTFRRMASVDGVITPLEDAKLSILDRGFLYGDSVYEVFRTYDGVPLLWREHLDRLENSAHLIAMPLEKITGDAARAELMLQIRETVAQAGGGPEQEVYVRFHMTRGTGPVDLFPSPDLSTTFVIMVKEVPTWNPDHYNTGMSLAVTDVRRNPSDAMNPNIKSGNYLNNILALSEAVQQGADDCLMLNHAGNVTEASNSNTLFVINDQLVTPDQASGNLKGLTAAAIEEAVAKTIHPIHRRPIAARELADVTECFVTSATREVMPVSKIRLPSGDWHELPAGGGPVTRQTAAAYKAFVKDYVAANVDARLW